MSWRGYCRNCGESYGPGNPCSCWLEAQNDDEDEPSYRPSNAPKPSYKQILACEQIAKEKGLWLPKNYDKDWEVASDFIARFGDRA